MGIIGSANDGYGRKRQFPRFFDRTVQTGANRVGEGDGGAIRCADSGHDRGRPVLSSIAIVSLNENDRARERVGQLFLQTISRPKRSRFAICYDEISPQYFQSSMRVHRINISAFEHNPKSKIGIFQKM
jgi:hypothetical protein